ncbi:uncharacterized protein LOC143362712 isoform X2 [Halictus rubicundus]|uniref:uncharacterized protein LOC143362712 isoform X2 n=1 Tax=Halictus rubicundus TaxID=77578 RepID=UPI0040375674
MRARMRDNGPWPRICRAKCPSRKRRGRGGVRGEREREREARTQPETKPEPQPREESVGEKGCDGPSDRFATQPSTQHLSRHGQLELFRTTFQRLPRTRWPNVVDK